MKRCFHIPIAPLRAYVDRFWAWEALDAPLTSMMLPGTGAELMFAVGSPIHFHDGVGGQAHLLSVRNAPLQPQLASGCGFFSVRLRSGALRHFCPAVSGSFFDQPVAIGDIWGAEGVQLAEQIALAPDSEARVALAQAWLLRCLARYAKPQPQVEAAVWQLYYRHRETRIDVLAEQLGLSRRHLERMFLRHLGLTPKAFLRTARFHQTVRDLLLAQAPAVVDVAMDHGYYDQPHFIHEFESFTGLSPSALLLRAQRTSHFYNHSLLAPDTVPLPR